MISDGPFYMQNTRDQSLIHKMLKFDSVMSHRCTIIIGNLWYTDKFSVFTAYNGSLFISLLTFSSTYLWNKMHIGHPLCLRCNARYWGYKDELGWPLPLEMLSQWFKLLTFWELSCINNSLHVKVDFLQIVQHLVRIFRKKDWEELTRLSSIGRPSVKLFIKFLAALFFLNQY